MKDDGKENLLINLNEVWKSFVSCLVFQDSAEEFLQANGMS